MEYGLTMNTIRSFIAVPLATPVQRALTKLIKKLARPDDGIRWVPTDNLHLTLKFLGDVDNTEIPSVCQAIRNCCADFEPFQIAHLGTGGMPSDQRARVLYAGVQDTDEQLSLLVGKLEKELAQLGFKPESRDYRPHLTLGRVRHGTRGENDETMQELATFRESLWGETLVDRVVLVASFLDKAGPTYQVMDTIQL